MPSAIERYKARAATLNAKLKSVPIERKAGLAVAGAAIGAMEVDRPKLGPMLPVTMMGLPTKPVLAVLFGLVEANTSGMVQKAAGMASDAAIATYFYAAAKKGTLIAGMGDDPVGDTEL